MVIDKITMAISILHGFNPPQNLPRQAPPSPKSAPGAADLWPVPRHSSPDVSEHLNRKPTIFP
jgi:hypothetical protein